MASIRYTGGATAIAQLQTYTFTGTWVVGETITVTYGAKTWTYTVASTVIATILAALSAAYNLLSASTYPEMAEQTAANTATTFTLTSDVLGRPFICTISTNSALGLINGAASSTGTETIASSGPEDASTPKNYSGGALPVNGDILTFDLPGLNLKYHLDALSAVTLAVKHHRMGWTGPIGLPDINQDGVPYPEYRPKALVLPTTIDYIGYGPGSGSNFLRLDQSNVAGTINMVNSGGGDFNGPPAVTWKGIGAVTLNHSGGQLGIAWYGGEVATVATINVSSGVGQPANLILGVGVTWTTITQKGGVVETSSAGTTYRIDEGQATMNIGAVTTLTVNGGIVYHRSSGTITNLVVSSGGSIDFTQEAAAKTVTNCTLHAGASLNDHNKRVTWTTPIVLTNCGIQDLALLDLGTGITLQPA